MNRIDELLYQYAPEAEKLWLQALPADDRLPEPAFSRSFQRKMRTLIRAQRRAPRTRSALRMAKRIAVAALAVTVLTFSCLMTVEACRAKFIQTVTKVFSDLTEYRVSSSWSEETTLGEMEFAYLPAGMVEVSRETAAEADRQLICLENEKGQYLIVTHQVITETTQSTLLVDTEDDLVMTIPFNGDQATLILQEDSVTLVWENGFHLFWAVGDVAKEEIIKFAEGITISE